MTKIVIMTDNKNLVYLDNNSNRTLKFESFLINFNFEIKHISGHSNQGANFLSRAALTQ